MKLSWFIALLLTGVALSGVLLHRHHRRTTAPITAQAHGIKPRDAGHKFPRLNPPRDYHRERQLLKKLRHEERRQKPEEGRN